MSKSTCRLAQQDFEARLLYSSPLQIVLPPTSLALTWVSLGELCAPPYSIAIAHPPTLIDICATHCLSHALFQTTGRSATALPSAVCQALSTATCTRDDRADRQAIQASYQGTTLLSSSCGGGGPPLRDRFERAAKLPPHIRIAMQMFVLPRAFRNI